MKYVIKNQKNEMGTYVMYDTERNPQRINCVDQGDVVTFEAVIPKAVFFTRVMVEGFGGACLFADNHGEGYVPSEEPMDFLREAAESRRYGVEKFAAQVQAKYGFIPTLAREGLDHAKSLLETGRSEDVESALCAVLKAGETIVLFDAENTIAKRGVRKSFAMGGCMKGFTDSTQEWRDQFKALFGHGVIPLHWGVLEPTPTEQHYDVVFEMLDWCRSQNIPTRGHALVWTSHWWEGKNWMGKLPFEEIRRLLVARAEYVLSERPNCFDIVDINEPIQCNPFNFTLDEFFQIVKEVYQVVKRLSPKTRIMVNFYDEWQTNYGYQTNDNEKEVKRRLDYGIPLAPANEYCCSVAQFLDHCMAEGVKVDILGLQFHDYPYDLFNTMEMLKWWHERYNLPIHLTEVSTPSGMGKTRVRMGKRPAPAPTAYWHKEWDERVQAEWYRQFVTLCYSTDYVESLVAWSMSDAPTQWADYIEGHPNEKFRLQPFSYDGLLDFDDKPKPAYDALKELLESWQLPDHPEWERKESR